MGFSLVAPGATLAASARTLLKRLPPQLAGDKEISIFNCIPCPPPPPPATLPQVLALLSQATLYALHSWWLFMVTTCPRGTGTVTETFGIFNNWLGSGADQPKWLPAHKQPWGQPYTWYTSPWRSVAASQSVGIFRQLLKVMLTCILNKNRTVWKFQRTFELV